MPRTIEPRTSGADGQPAPWIPAAPTDPKNLTTPTLLAIVTKPNAWEAQRRSAIETLGARSGDVETIAPVLVDALLDPSAAIRRAAARSLRGLEFDDASGSASLDRELKKETDEIRYWFAYQARQAKSARHGIEAGLLVPNTDIRIKAVELLARLGDEGKPSLPLLRRLRETCDDAELREAISVALSRFDGGVSELARALRDTDPVIRGRAALQLGRMGKPAVPTLRAALKEKDADTRASAIAALGRIGAGASDAVPDLKAVLKEEDPLLRRLAIDALRKIDPQAAD
jgi:HEAT repeat protein